MLRNSLAHLIARLAALGAGIVTIPLVTLTLGTEPLGLVGIYATLQAMLGLFDLGLPVAVNHRLALLIGRGAAPPERAELVRTVEALFWAMAALFVVFGLGLRGPLADSWLNVSHLSRATLDGALTAMIAAVGVRFPAVLYTNVLFAHDRHIYPNLVTAASAALRVLASLVALVWFDVGIVGFFVIQAAGSVAEILLLIVAVWRGDERRWSAPRWPVLKDIGAMAGGLTAVSLTAVVLAQIDKVILSKLLSLGDFGVYSAGYTLAAGLTALSYPVGNAVFPQLARSLDAASADTRRVVQTATELTVLILVPLGAVLVMQPEPLLRLLFLARATPTGLPHILPLMMLGGIAQGFVTLPHLFQVAAKRVRVVVWINAAFLVPYAAGVFWAARDGGIAGAAMAFAAFNIARVVVHCAVLLGDGLARPLWRSSIVTMAATLAGGLALAALPRAADPAGVAGTVVAALTVPVVAIVIALAMPRARARLLAFFGGASRP